MTAAPSHLPVLLEEAVAALNVRPDGHYIDGTFGRGGHSRRILAELGPRGRLLAIDRDDEAVRCAENDLVADSRFQISHRGFGALAAIVTEAGWRDQVDGLLLDLGVSSPQLDDAGRGFSFDADGPLDMRMDRSRGETAADWLMRAQESEIADVIHAFGEERFARRIARRIVERRQQDPIETTGQLAAIVAGACPKRDPHKHPATRTFQAIRIHVNRELGELEQCLHDALEVLARAGRLVVISFHSLEDRIVKRFMRDAARGPQIPKGVPYQGDPPEGKLRLIGKAVRPSVEEIAHNPRARSAIMRVAEMAA